MLKISSSEMKYLQLEDYLASVNQKYGISVEKEL